MGEEGLDTADVPRIQELLKAYQSNPEEWKQYAMKNEAGGTKYTRNLVDDGNGKFNLMILVWDPNVASPIHDHANSHCLVKVLDGKLTESLYEMPSGEGRRDSKLDMCEKPLPLIKSSEYSVDQVSYMHDKLGLHSISNKTASHSVSLHLYSPPYEYCNTFCPVTSEVRKSTKCTFYSVNGKRNNYMQEIRDKLKNPHSITSPVMTRPNCSGPRKVL
ncbi:hypothetical protein HDV02_005579 [Globomyces sp. JEL0801]|nr:hypothetical protein HDV02_005579 [Globomyces sp. JEL0801]